MLKRRLAVVAAPLLAAAIAAGPAHASSGRVPAITRHVIIPFSTNKSQNWSGYNQGSQEQGNKLFNAISVNWTVPTPSQHKHGQAEYSSNWVGIGGGCVDAGCTVTDSTLIQTGTEQDISAKGKTSYFAWWEIIPEPETRVSLAVHSGDKMSGDIVESPAGSNMWTITLKDLTTGKSFKTSTPYASSHLTAEWVEERPTLISTSGTHLAPLPQLSQPRFDRATTNGAAAALKSSEEMQMTDSGGAIVATPSAPDSDTDGFNDCTYATSCAAPSGS
jgi:Peptidase A4 family